jgi:pimeloyl-ACP methyl ester carboxylesterase
MTTLYAEEQGAGAPVLLIHGFPFHQKIWIDFIPRLSDAFRVITVDLPGFGKSTGLKQPFTIAQVAETLSQFIAGKNLDEVAVVGHSLGGYVALELANKQPHICSSLVLFHSTAYADTSEKKESRSKVLEFVNKNGAVPFTTGFIPPLFANPSHPAIEGVREIASQATSEAVIGYTIAMRDRPEHIKTLERFENPTLFLAGQKDPGIPVDSVLKQATHCQKPQIDILNDVAHMGMFEKPAETAEKIKGFLGKTHA